MNKSDWYFNGGFLLFCMFLAWLNGYSWGRRPKYKIHDEKDI